MAEIPLRGRDGAVRAYAIVDDADFEALSEHRWHLDNAGYARRTEYLGKIDGEYRSRAILMHRLLLELGPDDPQQSDHVNRVRLDNRRANLRVATPRENRENCGVRSSTGYRGVSLVRPGKWMARVSNRYLGVFDSPEEAAAVAATERARVMPFSDEARAA